MQTIIYHNPRCRKSREALDLLKKHTNNITVVEYLKKSFSTNELTELIRKLKLQPIELIRKTETVWKESYKEKSLSDEDLIQAMVKHPKLIERPIIVNEKGAVVGRPVDKVLKLL